MSPPPPYGLPRQITLTVESMFSLLKVNSEKRSQSISFDANLNY